MKSVLITGASTGIGRASAERLARAGWTVFAGVRKPADGEALVASEASITPVILDVSKPDQIAEAARTVSAALGGAKLSGLVNNAGIAQAGPLPIQPMDEIRAHFDVNVLGLVDMIQTFAPLLGMETERSGPPGRIINISSFGGRLGPPFLGAYGATKAAVESLTDSFRRELIVYGIDAITIAPGAIKTPIWDKAEEQDQKQSYSNSRWASSIANFSRTFLESGKKGWPPERLAELIETVLTTPSPQAYYAVGPQKLLNYTVATRLPKRLIDRGMWRGMGMKPPE